MLIDFKKAKRAELEAELDLYREGGAEVSKAKNEDFDTVDDCRDEIEKLQKETGQPVKLTPEFIAENKELAKVLIDSGAKEGEVVFAEEGDFEQAEALKTVPVPQDSGEAVPSVTKDEGTNSSGAKAPKGGADFVSVQYRTGIRVFTKELHGEDFKKLAEEFAEKHKGVFV